MGKKKNDFNSCFQEKKQLEGYGLQRHKSAENLRKKRKELSFNSQTILLDEMAAKGYSITEGTLKRLEERRDNQEVKVGVNFIIELADFLGTSTDYILGRDVDYESDLNEAICKATGLTEKSVNILKALNDSSDEVLKDSISGLNNLIEKTFTDEWINTQTKNLAYGMDDFTNIFSYINRYINLSNAQEKLSVHAGELINENDIEARILGDRIIERLELIRRKKKVNYKFKKHNISSLADK